MKFYLSEDTRMIKVTIFSMLLLGATVAEAQDTRRPSGGGTTKDGGVGLPAPNRAPDQIPAPAPKYPAPGRDTVYARYPVPYPVPGRDTIRYPAPRQEQEDHEMTKEERKRAKELRKAERKRQHEAWKARKKADKEARKAQRERYKDEAEDLRERMKDEDEYRRERYKDEAEDLRERRKAADERLREHAKHLRKK